MKKIIYIVTSGRYSDYGIRAVFENREKAEKILQDKITMLKAEQAGIV